jgi:hypothetical protein
VGLPRIDGVDKNDHVAGVWFRLAADQGHVPSLEILRECGAPPNVNAVRRPDDGAWPAGTRVVAVGLRNAADYNGRAGTIVRWMVKRARYKVDFDGAEMLIKWANLSRVTALRGAFAGHA